MIMLVLMVLILMMLHMMIINTQFIAHFTVIYKIDNLFPPKKMIFLEIFMIVFLM